MDPVTAFVIAVLMMLLNGGVLGLIHRDLPESLRPAAFSWRFGTLLVAAGCIVLAVQRLLPAWLALPLGNGFLMFGLAAYWRSLRQFDARPDHWTILAVPTAGTLALAWFAVVQPDIGARVLIASIVWATTLTACAVALHRSPEPAMARRVLIGILLTLAVFMLLRTVYFLTAARQVADVLDRASWMNMLTPLMAAVLPVIGTTAFLLMCSERIRRQWEHAASTDALTGLANRRTLTRVGGERLLRARERDDGFALAIVDVDHFKSINDRFGHDVGDLALRHVADALAAAGGTQALTGRHGGEEFVVLLPARGDAATTQAQRLREAVRNAPFLAPSNALTITVSIGVTDARAEDRSLDDLLRRADQALYTAKRDGRDRVVVA